MHSVLNCAFLLGDRDDTLRFGLALGGRLRAGDVVALIGDLGAGKTTLTAAIGMGMGITQPITSPTFTLVQEYSGTVPLYHFDTYRLESAEEMFDLGFEEYLERPGVVIIEWADRIATLLPQERLNLALSLPEPEKDQERVLENARLLRAEAVGLRAIDLLWDVAHVPEIRKLAVEPESRSA